jgi:hypothetical protein
VILAEEREDETVGGCCWMVHVCESVNDDGIVDVRCLDVVSSAQEGEDEAVGGYCWLVHVQESGNDDGSVCARYLEVALVGSPRCEVQLIQIVTPAGLRLDGHRIRL